MNIGVLTTSWPTEARPWAGHFIADLTAGLASRGHHVAVCAPSWRGEALVSPPMPRITISAVDLEIGAHHLPSSPEVWPLVLGGLHTAAQLASRAAAPDLWIANWWPTAIAAPGGAPCVAVLHGSDVDLAERLPKDFIRGLVTRLGGAIAVAPHLGQRFQMVSRVPTRGVVPLGASWSAGESVPEHFSSWASEERLRVLTVGRDALGKGLGVARDAAAMLSGVAWAFVTPDDGVGPAGVRALLRHADALVVPSRDGAGLPAEGRPHVMTQAIVAGVPIVGGPNRAVRTAVRELGQFEVAKGGPLALATAVQRALSVSHSALRETAQRIGRDYTWSAVLPKWEALLASCIAEERTSRAMLSAGR